MVRQLTRIILCVLSLGLLGFTLTAQSGVDPTFVPALSSPLPTNTSFQQVIQPDGKILVYNAPSMFVNGQLRGGLFRLNADGSTDPTFNVTDQGGVGINNLMVAPDGKIVLAGSASPNHAKMVRLNPDGSLDNSFSVFIQAVGSPDFTGNWLEINAIQPDGKVIATHGSWGNIQGTWYSYSMKRYNLNGSVDTSFQAPTLGGGHLVITTTVTEMLPDGRFYLAVTSRSLTIGGTMTISRRLANGAADTAYNPFSASMSSTSFLTISDLALGNDGGVLATGVLQQTAVGFPPAQQLRKYLPDGGLAGLNAPTVFTGSGVHELSTGKVLYSASGGNASRPLMRLEATGAVDATFQLDPAITSIINKWVVDPMERPVFLAQTSTGPRLVRLLDTGAIDPTFTPSLGAPGTSSVVALQPDGKVLVAGLFTGVGGVTRPGFARVHADGSLDATFDPGTGFNAIPRVMVVQPDGKIIAAGVFSSYNGTTVPPVVRINSNGSLDTTFSTIVGGGVAVIDSVALQADGKILIGGGFTAVQGISRPGVARLELNGALDATFNPVLNGTSIKSVVVEADGRITIGGTFTGDGGRANLARLLPSGAFDPGFVVSPPAIERLWRQPDGKYLYTQVSAPNILTRRNVDGSPDGSFSAPPVTFGSSNAAIRCVVPMPDGTLLIAGRFNMIGTHTKWHVSRLSPNGANDPSFLTTGANAEVFSLVANSTDKAIVGGSFSWIDNVDRSGIARLTIAPFRVKAAFDFDGDGRSDISVVRPSTNRWYEILSSTGAVHEETFGIDGDVLAPADFDGDEITDEAIFRPSNGHWWYRSSANGALVLNPFGGPGDIPRPSDFDGDGKADLVIFRPSNNTWYRYSSATNQEVAPKVFGIAGDKPLVGDFDGDGKSDLAIFRPSSGDWWYAASSAGGAFRTAHWGQNGDIPTPADYDGDGRTDYAVYRPSDGGWYIYNSGSGSFTTTAFGTNGDRPVAGDYDGDGRADLAVFRPSTGVWYLLQSTSGFAGYQFGISTDIAIPGALIP